MDVTRTKDRTQADDVPVIAPKAESPDGFCCLLSNLWAATDFQQAGDIDRRGLDGEGWEEE